MLILVSVSTQSSCQKVWRQIGLFLPDLNLHARASVTCAWQHIKTMIKLLSVRIWSPRSFSSFTTTNCWTLSLLCASLFLTMNPLFPAWNSLESLTRISLPLSLNNRFATELYSLSRAESLTQVSNMEIYWLSACAWCGEKQLAALAYCDNAGLFFPPTYEEIWDDGNGRLPSGQRDF